MYVHKAAVMLIVMSFINNSCGYATYGGGAIFVHGSGATTTVTLQGCTLSGNSAVAGGDDIWLHGSGGTATVTECPAGEFMSPLISKHHQFTQQTNPFCFPPPPPPSPAHRLHVNPGIRPRYLPDLSHRLFLRLRSAMSRRIFPCRIHHILHRRSDYGCEIRWSCSGWHQGLLCASQCGRCWCSRHGDECF